MSEAQLECLWIETGAESWMLFDEFIDMVEAAEAENTADVFKLFRTTLH